MTHNEIIEKKQAISQNDIDHYNRRLDEYENDLAAIAKKKNALCQKIGKKQIYINQLESDKKWD